MGLITLLGHWLGFSDELLRKCVHTLVGCLTVTFPWVFADLWPPMLLAVTTTAAMLALRWSPAFYAWAGRIGYHRALRLDSLGDVVHPITLGLLFVLGRGTPVYFAIAVLVITFADAAAAIVGRNHGVLRFKDLGGGTRTLEGSLACFAAAWLFTFGPLALAGLVADPLNLAIIAVTIALLATLLEAMSWSGLDNLFVPIPILFLTQFLVRSDLAMILWWAAWVLALAVLLVALDYSRRNSSRSPTLGEKE